MALFGGIRRWLGKLFGVEPVEIRRPRKRPAKPSRLPDEDDMPAGWRIEGFMPGRDQTSNEQWPDFEPYDGEHWPDYLEESLSARIIVSRTNADGSKDFGTIHAPVTGLPQVIEIILFQPDATVSPK